MKLLNKSLLSLSVPLLVLISIWALFFYFNMLNEIKESIDEGLENSKREIIAKFQSDSTIMVQPELTETFYSIRKIPESTVLLKKDRYIDTTLFLQDADDESPESEPVRLLSTSFEKNGTFYELMIYNSMVEEDDLIGELLEETCWLYFLLITSIILINNLVLKRLWKPFYALLFQLKKFKLDNNHNLPKVNTSTREFNDLQNAVFTLLNENLSVYERQKQFIGNASHELQTPLAIATNKLELLIERGNLNKEDAEHIAEIMETIERMVRLNKSLLLLTKIENKQYFDNQEVEINTILQQGIRDIEEFADFKQLTIQLKETGIIHIEMDPALAIILVSNLIRNAVFHNSRNGTVQIDITNNQLAVYNPGETQIPDPSQLFSRFYKNNTGHSGTGLGLAIVKAICELYGFTVSYRFINNQHCFTVLFKPAG